METDFKFLNNNAMHDGVALGLYGIFCMAAFAGSFTYPLFSLLFVLLLLGVPVINALLTFRYRRRAVAPTQPFGFFNGFFHSLLLGIYSSIWVALAVFVYLQFIDHGALFDAFEKAVKATYGDAGLQMVLAQTNTTGIESVQDLFERMRTEPPANYAFSMIDMSLFFSPLMALIIGLVCRRSGFSN